MAKRRVSGGTVTLGGTLADQTALRARIRRKAEAMVKESSTRIATKAKRRMPVKKGLLQKAVQERNAPGPPSQIRRVIGVWGKPANYVYFVKSTKIGKSKDATRLRAVWATEVRNPVFAEREPLAERLVKVLAQEITDG